MRHSRNDKVFHINVCARLIHRTGELLYFIHIHFIQLKTEYFFQLHDKECGIYIKYGQRAYSFITKCGCFWRFSKKLYKQLTFILYALQFQIDQRFRVLGFHPGVVGSILYQLSPPSSKIFTLFIGSGKNLNIFRLFEKNICFPFF